MATPLSCKVKLIFKATEPRPCSTRSGSVWAEQQQFVVGGSSGLVACRLSSDGNTAIVGATDIDVGGNFYPAQHVYFNAMEVFGPFNMQITSSNGSMNDSFGRSVALTGDGLIALVGADLDDVTHVDQGSALHSPSQTEMQKGHCGGSVLSRFTG